MTATPRTLVARRSVRIIRNLVLASVATGLFGAMLNSILPAESIDLYRAIDDTTIEVSVAEASLAWTMVWVVRETPSEVLVTVHTLQPPLPGVRDAIGWRTVHLSAPLGDRSVSAPGVPPAQRRP